jgi:hypothetical protein
MRQIVALVSVGVLLVAPGTATPQEHVVTRDSARQRLLEVEAARQRDLAAVECALSSPLAAEAAGRLGVDLERLRTRVPALSDAELSELAARAAVLRADPVAGLDSDVKLLLEIFLIVAIVILVLRALD